MFTTLTAVIATKYMSPSTSILSSADQQVPRIKLDGVTYIRMSLDILCGGVREGKE